ncbi:MAG TPA: DUF2510 domain-containing protein [Aeromicrobium sp.]|nr:DUF2510 domain-containing protein [Aeromicrobium sp.]
MTPSPPAGWYPDPSNPSVVRWHDGAQWTSATQPGPPASSAAHAYETIRKVLTALAVASLLLFGFLLFAGVEAGGTNCGSPASPRLTELVGAGNFWGCREAIDTREMWVWIAFGLCVILLVIAVIVGKAGRKLERN